MFRFVLREITRDSPFKRPKLQNSFIRRSSNVITTQSCFGVFSGRLLCRRSGEKPSLVVVSPPRVCREVFSL